MTKIKVLQIGMHDQRGGIEAFLMNYYRKIDKNKISFDFLMPYPDGGFYDDEIRQLGGNIYYFTFKKDKNIFKLFKDLNDFFKTHSYDIVHCSDNGLGAFYLYFAKKNNIEIRIAHSHSTSVESGLKGKIKLILQKFYIKQANVYFACSKEAGKYLFGKKRFTIIPNAIEYSRFVFDKNSRKHIREEISVKNTEYLLGNVGRICEQKNQAFLLSVIKQLPSKYKLLIIGDGPLKDNILKKIQELNLENRIILLSSKENIEDYYQAMDLFLLPSLYEGLGIAGVEAQVSGLPCIFSKFVPKAVSIHSHNKFLDINDADIWKKEILKFNKKREKKFSDSYEMDRNVEYLENQYLKLVKESEKR